jgi:surface antigen
VARLRPLASAAALGLALANGGCAVSGQVSGLFTSDKPDADADLVTGSIKAQPVSATPSSGLPPDADLAYARSAVAELLGTGRPTTSANWENPRTGARGTITPIASIYVQDGSTCRDFLASYVRDRVESWMQGEACRAKQGPWQVKSLKPWKRS